MGPLQVRRMRWLTKERNEETIIKLALEAGMSELEINKELEDRGLDGLIDKLLKILNDPRLAEIVKAIKNLLLLIGL